jgi:hypothetical protein
MKHLIVLPGNNIRNKEWGERMLSHYGEYFDTLYLQEYDHWGGDDDADMDMVIEEEKLRAHSESLEKGTQVFVLAKSAGSILCIGAVQAGFLNPVYAAFFGVPLEWAITDVFGGNWRALESYSIPTIAFHNTNDPVATYAYTKEVIDTRMPKVSLITTEGSDHNYDEIEVYDTYLLPMFQK